jgi:uracil-DNA glycosylase family 4
MLIGQNPGEEEDKVGKPFVGRAGKFLNEVLTENGINRQELFVTNIVKHKTPNNRKPLADEIEACVSYLVTQMREIQPKLVLLMGEVAWRTPRKEGITYFETYHPAAAMRFPRAREKFKRDFAKIKTLVS